MPVRWRRVLVALSFLVVAAVVYRQALAGQVYFGRDAMGFFLPNSTFLREALAAGEFPLWIPYVRLGQPFAATLSTQAFYPPHLLLLAALEPVRVLTGMQVFHALLAAAGAFACFRALGALRLPAAVAAIAFGFSPMLTDLAGQQNVVAAAAWTGFLLLAADRLARAPSLVRAGALAVTFALSLLAGSPETTLWQGILVAAVLASARRTSPVETVRTRTPHAGRPGRFPRALLPGTIALVWGLALAAVAIVPAVEFLRLSARGARADTLEWSTSWHQLLALAWPLADHPRGAYWDGPDQWFVLTVFLGTILITVAAFGITTRRLRLLAVAGVLLVLLAAGRHSPLTAWVFSAPPFGWFRYPAKYLVGVSFVIALLASRGLPRLAARSRGVRRQRRTALLLAAGLVGVFALGSLFLPRVLRPGALSGGIWVVLAVGVPGAALLAIPGPTRVAVRLLGACVLLELALFHLYLMRGAWIDPAALSTPSSLAARMPDRLQHRVSVGGPGTDDPFALRGGARARLSREVLLGNRFIEERLHAVEGIWAPELLAAELFQLSGERAAYDLASVSTYVRHGAPPFADLEAVAESAGTTVYRSDTALPRAFVVHRAEVVDDATALARVLELEQPARETAYLAEGEPFERAPCGGSTAHVVAQSANTLRIDVDACGDGLLVVSDTYFPGWSVTVDGARADVLRVDLALRGVRLPKGHHRIDFRYAPTSVSAGAGISALAWVALAAVAIWRRRMRPGTAAR